MWSVTGRINNLRYSMLPKDGAIWRGTDAQFIEFVHRSIEQMPDPIGEVMKRYYIEGDTPERDESTGRRLRHDKSFYLHLAAGRKALAFRILEAQNAPKLTTLIGGIYGRL